MIVFLPELCHPTLVSLRCIAAYALVILPNSSVKLKVIHLGNEGRGFAVFARRRITKGEILYDLPGLITSDTKAPHTELSSIRPHPSQIRSKKSHILFGPVRFINHSCSKDNVAVSNGLF